MIAKETILSTFFERHSFEIPDYQRGYDWRKSNFDMLWDDILYYLNDTSKLFLGSIILQKTTENHDRFYIVDGQQRITTITILLIALRSALYNRRDEAEEKLKGKRETTIEEKYLYNHDYNSDPTTPKFLASTSIRDALVYMCSEDWKANQDFPSKIVKDNNNIELSDEFKQIKPVYEYFLSKILERKKNSESYKYDLKTLYKILELINGAQIVQMTVDSEKEAFYLFEVVNARGEDLQVGDLLKNHIFSQINREDANKLWNNIIENTNKKGPELTRALRYFYFSEGGYISSKELYTKLKGLVKKENRIDSISKLLENINQYSEFHNVINGEPLEKFVSNLKLNDKKRGKLADKNNQQEMYESISALNLFKFTQTQPLIYGFFNNYNNLTIDNKANYDALSKLPKIFLEALENFHFINYCVGDHRANEVEQKYAELAYAFNYADDIHKFKSTMENLLKFIQDNKDKRKIFIEKFSDNITYTASKRNIIHYIYHKINRGHNLNNLQIWVPNTSTNFNIEHWASVKKVGDKSYEKIRGLIHIDTLNKFGNLISIDSDQNSSLQDGNGNFSPKQKYDWFNKSRGENYNFQNQFLDDYKDNFESWDEKSINLRTEKIAEYAYQKIWLIPTI